MKNWTSFLLAGLLSCMLTAPELCAAPSIKTTATATGSDTTVFLAKPDGTQASDLLIATLFYDGEEQVDITEPSGWTQIRRANNNTYIGIAAYFRTIDSAEPDGYSFALGKATPWAAGISRISGADLTDPINTDDVQNGRRGNVIAPSITTTKDNTLVLAFFSNRLAAQFTPSKDTSEQYDVPNTAQRLPSNMLATYSQPAAGSTGEKRAKPTRSNRRWIAMQVAVNGMSENVPAEDQSEFQTSTVSNTLSINTAEMGSTNKSPLLEELSLDPGEPTETYTTQQSSLTNAPNPDYSFSYQPADFEILKPEKYVPPSKLGIWTSSSELAMLPMTGDPWIQLQKDADTYWGIPNLSDQEDKANIYTMAKALVYARTGIESYRTEVIQACMQAIGSEEGGSSLALGRNLAAFILAADLVGLPAEEDAIFRKWLHTLPEKTMADNRSLISAHETKPTSWGTHPGASRAAIAAYLGDQNELNRVAQVFKGWLGDRNSYSGFIFTDLGWQNSPETPVAINPSGAAITGFRVDGALPEELQRDGAFAWPPPKVGTSYEVLQGALAQAVILSRAGYDVWNWEDQALLRAFTWLYNTDDYPAAGDDLWQPFIINCYYNTAFPTPVLSEPGKNIARTCWTHSELYDPAGTANDPGSPENTTDSQPATRDLDFFAGDYSADTVIGNRLPGTWRPFSSDSPWNTPIATDAPTHPDSDLIVNFALTKATNIRLVGEYLTPIWVVNTDNALPLNTPVDSSNPMELHLEYVSSDVIFDTWDQNRDGWSDVPIPLAKGTYPEPTEDGHIIIVDPFRNISYEMSRYNNWTNGTPTCTTFNIWDLTGSGVGDPFEGDRWWARGGKGSGFPLIAAILRPEELEAGEIRHALTFSFSMNRRADSDAPIMMWPTACRSDGKYMGEQYPIEGMLFQLDPTLTEADFDRWGLTAEAKTLARALQTYGMYLGDNGGDMALSVQLLGPDAASNRAAWDARFPDFYRSVKKIPTDQFRVVHTVEPTIR